MLEFVDTNGTSEFRQSIDPDSKSNLRSRSRAITSALGRDSVSPTLKKGVIKDKELRQFCSEIFCAGCSRNFDRIGCRRRRAFGHNADYLKVSGFTPVGRLFEVKVDLDSEKDIDRLSHSSSRLKVPFAESFSRVLFKSISKRADNAENPDFAFFGDNCLK